MPRPPRRSSPDDTTDPTPPTSRDFRGRKGAVPVPSPTKSDPADTEESDGQTPADAVAEDGDVAAEGPESRAFIVRRELHTRLDVYLHQRLKGISRTRVQKLIDAGGVTINAQVPKSSTTIHRGDRIDVILPPPAVRTIEPEDIPLDILYEDDDFLVINKQADLIVHPARSHLTGTLLNALAHHFRQQANRSGPSPLGRGEGEGRVSPRPAPRPWRTRGFQDLPRPRVAKGGRHAADGAVPGLSSVGAIDLRPGIVHRLDKNTTGVMVVAKNDQAHWQIARQFEDRKPVKAYLAVVHGNFDQPGGVVDEPIGKHPTIREAYAVRHDSTGRRSVTLFRVREQYAGYSLVELELKTGRTHQIRVHLSYLCYPIVGDIIYGGEPVGPHEIEHPPVPAGGRRFLPFAREREEGLRLEAQALARAAAGAPVMAHPALHAAFLRFTHPGTGALVTFIAPMHGPMAALVRTLRAHRIDAPVAREGCWVDLVYAVGA
jgi:23S rRNA pseudouridine1911/1915/1917 synthase